MTEAINSRSSMVRTLLLGGVLPVVAFAVVEEIWGAKAGLVAGMVFGGGEIIWEWYAVGRVQLITWAGNALLIVLGVVSIISDDGAWFKLQPALIEGCMTLALFGSQVMGKPLMVQFAAKQMPADVWASDRRPFIEKKLAGMNFRLGIFFAIHTGLAVWSALYWSTASWAILKGVGFTASMGLYVAAEFLWARSRGAADGQ